jgi:glutamate:GABA antiporter
MSTLEGQYKPTALQQAMGDALRSEQRTGELFPRVLSSVDLLTIFIVIVLFIPNVSIVLATRGTGLATYVYWVIVTVTFLLPGALVTGQLNHFMPSDGAIYVWTHRALGPLWGFFAGFCAWIPGVLVLLAATDYLLSLVQGIGIELVGSNANWLSAPWQQGIFVLVVLLFSGWLSLFSTRFIMQLAKWVVVLYCAGIFMVGLAGVVWLLQGHGPQVPLTTGHLAFGGQNLVLYGVIVLALLGVEVPLNMAAETKQPNAATLFLRWGPPIVLLAYLFGTFGVMTVVPPQDAESASSTLLAVAMAFNTPVAVLVGITFISFFLIVTVIYNITFARILVVSALDHRLPRPLAKVNRRGVPYFANNTQVLIVIGLAVFTYFIGPLLYPEQGVVFSFEVYNVLQATTTIIWCVSMTFLFLDLPMLLLRFRTFLAKHPDQLLAPPWVLYACCLLGGAASLLGIWTTLSASWIADLIHNPQWSILVGTCTLISLFIGLLGSAYPRLLSSLNEQTAAARENAHLYEDLRTAYAKLSELDQLKDAFLTTAGHELRTPLTIVQGYLELLGEMDDDISPEIRHNFINKARRACDELVLLQANIMDASRIEFDATTLLYTSLNLKEVSTAVVELFEPLILQEQRDVEVAIDQTITVRADETRLKQVLRNLIANALRYSPQCTPIHLTAEVEREQDLVRISVTDRGPGIPPDKQEAIFDKFVRLERDMHGTISGSGLGLYITKQLVEAMHGTITIESTGVPGEGSTFTFTLPLEANAVS